MDAARRTLLKGAVAASSLFLPVPYAWVWAQSEGTFKLLRLPKVALVIGNSAYSKVPALINPANDAKAIADALAKTGFEVTMRLDGSRADMMALVQAHVRKLTEAKCVGLFYFAGHGLQLGWRNYLAPVDVAIATIEDVPKQCVEVGSLMEGLGVAANPINLIILDACRQNPFAGDFRDVQQGLSQMDAPPSTLLAYATAPGNVASDGDSANGLYTEHLLKEMLVKEAKIEDVFKRVRLGVRRGSNGAQIPWESTSLEDDFYFLPPRQLKEQSDAEREREFQEQFSAWEKLKTGSDSAAFIEFLTRYPSGHFSELAHRQLDQLLARQGEKKVTAQSSESNPFTKGSAALDTQYKIGDSYSYRMVEPDTGSVRRRYTTTISDVTDTQVIFDKGLVTDLQGNTQRMSDGRVFTDNQNVPVEFAVGKQWTTRYQVTLPQGQSYAVEMNYVVVSREQTTVPAGTFNAFLIEGIGTTSNPKGKIELHFKFWWDPQRVRRPIAREEVRQIRIGGSPNAHRRWRHSNQEKVRVISSERHELIAFRETLNKYQSL